MFKLWKVQGSSYRLSRFLLPEVQPPTVQHSTDLTLCSISILGNKSSDEDSCTCSQKVSGREDRASLGVARPSSRAVNEVILSVRAARDQNKEK